MTPSLGGATATGGDIPGRATSLKTRAVSRLGHLDGVLPARTSGVSRWSVQDMQAQRRIRGVEAEDTGRTGRGSLGGDVRDKGMSGRGAGSAVARDAGNISGADTR